MMQKGEKFHVGSERRDPVSRDKSEIYQWRLNNVLNEIIGN
jgi:hypothetical protein